MRRLGVISIVLLGMAFAASTAAWSMYQYARATRGICACQQCESHYFGTSRKLDPPWVFEDQRLHRGRRIRYPTRVFLTFKRDPAGVLPITGTQVFAVVSLVAGMLCGAVWMCGVIVSAPARIRHWRRRRADVLVCRACGYDLRGLTADCCPECGRMRPQTQVST